MVRLLPSLLGVALLLPIPAAYAQESASEVAMARRLFREGVEAARGRQWEEARASFERSYELSPRPITLLNLAGAQAALGLVVEASESYRRFLSNPGARSRRHIPEARRALEGLLPRIAHLRLGVEGLGNDDRLRIDGNEVSHAVLEGELPVNPGEHEISVERRDGTEAAREIVQLGEGESREVSITVPPPPPEVPMVPVEPEPDEGGGALRSPWLWTGVGAAVVLGVVVTVVVARGGGDGGGGPFVGNVGIGSWEVR